MMHRPVFDLRDLCDFDFRILELREAIPTPTPRRLENASSTSTRTSPKCLQSPIRVANIMRRDDVAEIIASGASHSWSRPPCLMAGNELCQRSSERLQRKRRTTKRPGDKLRMLFEPLYSDSFNHELSRVANIPFLIVSLRSCQALLESQHAEQDARGCQGCRLCHRCAGVSDC